MRTLAVLAPRRFARLMAADAMNIGRDPMMLFAIALSFAPGIGLSLGRDSLDAAALDAFAIADFSRFLAPVALLVPAALVGWVTGFLLLEDRDDGPLLAIDVTPVGKAGFLAYRATATALALLAITLLAAPLVVPQADAATKLALAVFVAAEGVLFAAVLPAIARNKVEGLALTKLTNFAALVPLLAIIPSPWRYAGGLVPTYWIGELLRLSGREGLSFPAVIACAMASHLLTGAGLYVLLRRRAG